MSILVRIIIVSLMKWIQDFHLVTIIVSHNHFWPQMFVVAVDLSYQNESVKTSPIDVRISIELKTPSYKNTQAYCLLLNMTH